MASYYYAVTTFPLGLSVRGPTAPRPHHCVVFTASHPTIFHDPYHYLHRVALRTAHHGR